MDGIEWLNENITIYNLLPHINIDDKLKVLIEDVEDEMEKPFDKLNIKDKKKLIDFPSGIILKKEIFRRFFVNDF